MHLGKRIEMLGTIERVYGILGQILKAFEGEKINLDTALQS